MKDSNSVDRFYFDHNASTPVPPEVLDALTGALRETCGNASSVHHFGQEARRHLETARRSVAALLNCAPKELVLTSGGTESDNLAVFGVARRSARPGRHVITTAIEHPAVLNACAQLEREGVEVTYIRPSPEGVVDPDDVRRALRPETVLISVIHASNELGTVQPVAEIARIGREAGVAVHSDGVQAAGKIPVDVAELGVDLYAVSAHKLYAPKGVGALYVREGVELAPLLFGGRHEGGRRPGTENVPGAAAFARAAELALDNLADDGSRIGRLRDRLEEGILARVPESAVNGAGAPRVPNTTNIRFAAVSGEAMLIALDLAGFAVSSGAACSSGAVEPSHVLTAIGLSRDDARASLRFSLGRGNTTGQVDALIEAVAAAASHLRRLSPEWAGHAR